MKLSKDQTKALASLLRSKIYHIVTKSNKEILEKTLNDENFNKVYSKFEEKMNKAKALKEESDKYEITAENDIAHDLGISVNRLDNKRSIAIKYLKHTSEYITDLYPKYIEDRITLLSIDSKDLNELKTLILNSFANEK